MTFMTWMPWFDSLLYIYKESIVLCIFVRACLYSKRIMYMRFVVWNVQVCSFYIHIFLYSLYSFHVDTCFAGQVINSITVAYYKPEQCCKSMCQCIWWARRGNMGNDRKSSTSSLSKAIIRRGSVYISTSRASLRCIPYLPSTHIIPLTPEPYTLLALRDIFEPATIG